MKKKILIIICGIVVLEFLLFFLTSSGKAQVVVNCPTDSLQDAINAANPEDTISVTGTCSENVSIWAFKNYITLDGGTTAIINGPNSNNSTISVEGSGIRITRFTISGGMFGVSVLKGNAYIENNIIENTAMNGIHVGLNSSAQILNNTIQNNPLCGIMVFGNSSAFIGIISPLDTVAYINTIQKNGTGIIVRESSSAWIVGNTINDNTSDGVRVDRCSHAQISSNIINGNGLNGISVSQNSGVNLGNDTGSTILDIHNVTTAKNGRWGINASLGAYVDGRRGSLKGVKGRILVGSGSIDSTIP